jgi:hypothetical protein
MSSGHPLQNAIEVSQTALDEKNTFLLHAWKFSCIRTPQNGAVGLTGLIGDGPELHDGDSYNCLDSFL